MNRYRAETFKIATFFIVIFATIALHGSISMAIVMDKKGPRINYCPDETRGVNDNPTPDTSCLDAESNTILLMGDNDISNKIQSMKIEDIVDVYLCAYQSKTKGDKKFDILANKIIGDFSQNLDYLLSRLKQEHDDTRVAGILLIFIVYVWTAYDKECHSRGECAQNTEHILQPDVARLLVSKAEAVHDCGDRNGLLDYLLPFLPLEEGLAKQNARDDEARRKAGNQE